MLRKHYKVQNISEDFKGNFYPNLSDLLDMLWNFTPYKKPSGDIYHILPMTYIKCCVCGSYKYVNRYGNICYNRSVVCIKCRTIGIQEINIDNKGSREDVNPLLETSMTLPSLTFCYICVKSFRINKPQCLICGTELEEIESIRFKTPRKRRLDEYM